MQLYTQRVKTLFIYSLNEEKKPRFFKTNKCNAANTHSNYGNNFYTTTITNKNNKNNSNNKKIVLGYFCCCYKIMKEHYRKKKTTKNKEKQRRNNNQRDTRKFRTGALTSKQQKKKESLLKNNKIYAKSVKKSSLNLYRGNCWFWLFIIVLNKSKGQFIMLSIFHSIILTLVYIQYCIGIEVLKFKQYT